MKAKHIIVLLALGAVAAGVAAYRYRSGAAGGPLERRESSSAAERPAPPSAPSPSEESVDYSPVWETLAPARPEPAKPAIAKPSVNFRLKGVLLQKAERVAVIQDSTGRQRLIPEGGSIEGAKVTKISPDKVTIEIGGETMTLPLETKGEAMPGAPAARPSPPAPRR